LHHPGCNPKKQVETNQSVGFAASGGPKSQLSITNAYFWNYYCTQMDKQRDLSFEEKTKALAWRVDEVSRRFVGKR
jgi:hypothetical protein